MQDEMKALQLCQSKVRAKKLPMEVVDAEYQWYVVTTYSRFSSAQHFMFRDRRKLTFYFIAEKRIDFRELVRELFRYVLVKFQLYHNMTAFVRLYKTRIWMASLQGGGGFEQ